MIDFMIGNTEFYRQGRGGGSPRLIGQNGSHLSLDATLLRLQPPHSQSMFLKSRPHSVGHNNPNLSENAKDKIVTETVHGFSLKLMLTSSSSSLFARSCVGVRLSSGALIRLKTSFSVSTRDLMILSKSLAN